MYVINYSLWPLTLDLYVALNPLYRMFVLLVDTKMRLIVLLVEFTVNFCKRPQYFPISVDCRINPSLICQKKTHKKIIINEFLHNLKIAIPNRLSTCIRMDMVQQVKPLGICTYELIIK